MSDGYIAAVRSGAIVVRRDRAIVALGDGPKAQLDGGESIPADLVIAATGFEQDTPFLDEAVNVRDEDGNFELFRRILPHDVPNLTFCGYNSSVFSTINAEIGAVWTAAYLAGALAVPPVEDRRKQVILELAYMRCSDQRQACPRDERDPVFDPKHRRDVGRPRRPPQRAGNDWRNADGGSCRTIIVMQSTECFETSTGEPGDIYSALRCHLYPPINDSRSLVDRLAGSGHSYRGPSTHGAAARQRVGYVRVGTLPRSSPSRADEIAATTSRTSCLDYLTSGQPCADLVECLQLPALGGQLSTGGADLTPASIAHRA